MTQAPVLLFSKKQLQGRYCLSPFVMIEVAINGDVRMCGCGSWMPTTIGNLKEQTLESMLASTQASNIRQSIIDGTYQYCNEHLCGVMANDALNSVDTVPAEIKSLLTDSSKFVMPRHISFQGDRTCNLSCPSCRTGVIKTPEDQLESQKHIGQLIYQNLFSQPSDQQVVLEVSGTGEFFASELLMSFANSVDIDAFPGVVLHIGTNGLLAPSRWNRIEHLASNIEKITVSIDATQASTYEKLRRGGNWQQLLEAMSFLQNKKHQTGMKLHTRMIVQQQNYTEMLEFYHFSKTFDADVVEYSRITNWGTWSYPEFKFVDVFAPDHPEQALAQQQLSQVKQLNDAWFGGL